MASATGIPNDPVDRESTGADDMEPLLGRPGDASQRDNAPIAKNLIIGTGIVAEGASLLLVASVWAAVFLHGSAMLFTVHPLAQSLGMLVLVQSILILQPTHTGQQKVVGQKIHAGLNMLAIVILGVGVISIEVNKIRDNGKHFKSVHGYLGVIASFWLLFQYLVGLTMYATPKLYGSEARAKSIWKYHRISGYVLFLFLQATVISATQTDYNFNVLGLKLWAFILISVLIIVGVYPRIKKQKLGL
ncbi:putative Eukaryotic cytochrome b561-domain-containing protein [Seiridium cardinale]|uniref:Eukaryotic cytochrome b561-domain-containing protein n=1 Tax=Seiridium cardinale TaxID=138064 RepID=A0ABR2X6K5_9PEZI